MKMTTFQIEQLVHLSNQVVDYLYQDEENDYNSRLTKFEIKDINPELTSLENYQIKLNDSDHIFKYVFNLKRLLNEIADRTSDTG